jgi:hypothetical protein
LTLTATEGGVADGVHMMRRLDFADSFTTDVEWTTPLYQLSPPYVSFSLSIYVSLVLCQQRSVLVPFSNLYHIAFSTWPRIGREATPSNKQRGGWYRIGDSMNSGYG